LPFIFYNFMSLITRKFFTKEMILLFSCLLILVISVFSLVILSTYFNPKQRSLKHNLTIKVGNCSGAGPDIQKINSTEWSNNSFIIKTTISPNCGQSRIIADYEIQNEALIIKYRAEHRLFESGEMACICPTAVSFTISDIVKKEYHVILQDNNSL